MTMTGFATYAKALGALGAYMAFIALALGSVSYGSVILAGLERQHKNGGPASLRGRRFFVARQN